MRSLPSSCPAPPSRKKVSPRPWPRDRRVSLDAGELTIELDVLTDGSHRKLVGQLVPAEVATIEVQSAEQRQAVTADSQGRFHAEGISVGRMRLRITVHSLSDRPIETSWIMT